MSEENKKYSIGGSALMEGIMMIGPKGVGMSLRMPDGSIETQLKKQTMLKDKHKIARIPFIRGPINFVDQMIFTYKCMMESAEKTSMDIEDGGEEDMSKLDKWLTDHFGPKMMTVIGVISARICSLTLADTAFPSIRFIILPPFYQGYFLRCFRISPSYLLPFRYQPMFPRYRKLRHRLLCSVLLRQPAS